MSVSNFISRSLPILKISALSAVVVFLMIIGYTSIGSSYATRKGKAASKPTMLAGCSRIVESFCQAEHDFKQYVANQSASDLFEHQLPTPVTCDGSSAVKAYCSNTAANVQLRLAPVSRANSRQLLKRNDYIKLLRSYLSQHGPFNYSATVQTQDGVNLVFTGHNANARLVLQFQRQSGVWQFIIPQVEE